MKNFLKSKKFKIILFILILGIACGFTYGYFKNIKDFADTNIKSKEPKVINKVANYELKESNSSYFKKEFKNLEKAYNEKEEKEPEYVEVLSKLFVADFYTLSNKYSRNDIGGTDFIHKSGVETFKNKAKDSFYSGIKTNFNDDRKQKLPEVSNVEVISNEAIEASYKDNKDENAYVVKLNLSYKENLSYPENVVLTFIHVGNDLKIIDVK